MPIFMLSDKPVFPPPHLAEPNGLLAVGGDLSRLRLLAAYRMGIFPWYSRGEPILWWSPDPRLVLYPEELHVSRSLRRIIRQARFRITLDRAFDSFIEACGRDRVKGGKDTWLVPEMVEAYRDLHRAGYAHSVEAWAESGRLVGGLYGVAIGRCFFGESMFSRVSNASKVALTGLSEHLRVHGFQLIDCQVTTAHLIRFGAREISRKQFLHHLRSALAKPALPGSWESHRPCFETGCGGSVQEENAYGGMSILQDRRPEKASGGRL